MVSKIALTDGNPQAYEFEDSAFKLVSQTLAEGARIGVACSGGADSVFLLCAICALADKHLLKNISVLHFNHKARANAEADEAFVLALAERLGVDCEIGAPSESPSKMSEDEFRRMRLAFFLSKFSELKLSCIAQGHHGGDVAETSIMRIMRGAGLDGMCAPRPISEVGGAIFARPLLRLKKSEICESLKTAGIDWREDESNVKPMFLRNRIRSEIVPALDQMCGKDFASSALRTRSLLQEDADFIAAELESELKKTNDSDCGVESLKISERILSSRSLIRRAVMKILCAASLSDNMRSEAVDAFLSRLASGDGTFKASAGNGSFLCYDAPSKTIFIERESQSFEMPLKIGKNILPDGSMLTVKRITMSPARRAAIKAGENDDSARAYLDLSAAGNLCDGALIARNKRSGDAYQPMGSKTSKRLKDIFVSKKIMSAKRNSIPLVCNKNGKILWGPGLPPNDKFKLDESSVAIELTFSRP